MESNYNKQRDQGSGQTPDLEEEYKHELEKPERELERRRGRARMLQEKNRKRTKK